MGGLAHVIESEGIATTQISLVRLHSEKMEPPRALWVPFELGRPLGAPGDPAFQTRVLRAVLAQCHVVPGGEPLHLLLHRRPEAAAGLEVHGWRRQADRADPALARVLDQVGRRLLAVVLQNHRPVAAGQQAEHGRTTVGLSGLDMPAAVDFVCAFLDGELPDNPRDDLSLSESLKFAVDDLKAFYREAALAQPGANTGEAMNDWFYGETATGRALFALKPIAVALATRLDDGFMATFGRALLIPHTQRHREQQGGTT